MSKIIDFPKETEKEVKENKKKKPILQDTMDSIGQFVNLDGTDEFVKLLSLPDKEFLPFSKLVLSEFEAGLRDANSRLEITKALNSKGLNASNLGELASKTCEAIDTQLSEIFSVVKRDFLKQLIMLSADAVISTSGIATEILAIPFEKDGEALTPDYANVGDAGMDIYALEDIDIEPGETKLVKTGIKIAVPLGYEIQVRPKSGISLNSKMRIGNAPGTIDSQYRGEIGIIVDNIDPPIKDITYDFDEKHRPIITSILHGSPIHIAKGTKVAQLVISKVVSAHLYPVNKIEEIEGNRGGGFGSSGLTKKVKDNVKD